MNARWDRIERSRAAWSAGEVVKAFKGATKKDVEPLLESLAALGLVLAFETKDGRRWKGAGG